MRVISSMRSRTALGSPRRESARVLNVLHTHNNVMRYDSDNADECRSHPPLSALFRIANQYRQCACACLVLKSKSRLRSTLPDSPSTTCLIPQTPGCMESKEANEQTTLSSIEKHRRKKETTYYSNTSPTYPSRLTRSMSGIVTNTMNVS